MRALQLPFKFEVDRILEEVQAFSEAAKREVQSSYISAGGLLAVDLLKPIFNEATRSGDLQMQPTAHLQKAPYLHEISETLQGRKSLYRVHLLQPGAAIQPHHDGMSLRTGRIRIHIPVTGNAGSSFVLDGEPLHMEPGSCWFLDVSRKHHVNNRGTEERVHLVMDCYVDAWWEALLGV